MRWRRATYSIRSRGQGVTYAEVTLSAGVVLWKQQDLAAVYDAVWRESQRSPVKTFWILDAIRQFGPEKGMEVAEFAVSRRDEGIIAYGIGGDEVRGPAHWFRDVFAYARDGGLHLVCHAGETAGPESVWAALAIGAERIGHGIAAAKDPGVDGAASRGQRAARSLHLEQCLHGRGGRRWKSIRCGQLYRRGSTDHDQHRRSGIFPHHAHAGI